MADEIRIKHTAGLGTLTALGWVGGSRINGAALVTPNTITAANWGTTGAVTLTEKQTSDAQGVGLYVGTSLYVADGLQEWFAFEGAPTPATDDVARVGFYLLDGVGFESAVDALLNQQLAKVNAAVIRVASPVLDDASIEIVQADDYEDADGRSLSWTIQDWSGPAVGTLSVTFRLMTRANYDAGTGTAALSVAGSVALVGADAVFKVELTAAQTLALASVPPGDKYNYRYQLLATDGGGDVLTQALGACTVKRRVTP